MHTFATILLLALASFYDLRERRIPDALTYSAIALGALYWIFLGSYVVVPYVVGTFVVSYVLYRMGLWAGGDVKLFTAVAALNPYEVSIFGASLPFPLALFLASILAAFLLSFPIMLYRILRAPNLRRTLLHSLLPIASKSFSAAALLYFFGLPGFIFLILPSPADLFSALAVVLTHPNVQIIVSFAILFGVGLFFRVLSMRVQVFRKKKSVDELEDGDVPADFILEDGSTIPFSWKMALLAEMGKIPVRYSPLRAAGLYPNDIRWLKNKGVESINVRTTMPFVPFVAVAYIFLLILHYL